MDIEPADQILCDCLGRAADDALGATLEALSPAEWQTLLEHAGRHGVAPLLYYRLKKLAPTNPSFASTRDRLRAIYLSSAQRNIRIYNEAEKLLAALATADIPVIALKGIYLAEWIYGNIALRPMSDIDILVRKDDLPRVAEVFAALGYTNPEPCQDEAVCASCQHLAPFSGPDKPTVEIHWTIAEPRSPFAIDPAGLWQRAQPISIAGVELWSLSAEDTLLHLCLHAAYHHLFSHGLRAFCDIAELLRYFHNQMDWEQLSCRARQWGANRCVYFNLYLARQLLGVEVPDDAVRLLKPAEFDETVAALARDYIFGNSINNDSEMTPGLAAVWSDITLSQKMIVLLRLFAPPEDLNGTHPASSLLWRTLLYFPTRLRYLISRYGSTLWRLIRHDNRAIISLKRQQQDNNFRDWLSRH